MIKTKIYKLPVNYNKLKVHEKRAVRLQYIKEQDNKCCYCHLPLNEIASYEIESSWIDWTLFPDNFREFPVHLHHDHITGMTIGATHMRCNAYMWQYKGE